MAILRNQLKSHFSQLPNALISDKSLYPHVTFRIICYLYSKPDGWVVNNDDIMKKFGIKDPHTMAKYWKVILHSGWVSRTKKDSKTSKFSGYDYTLNQHSIPYVDLPHVEAPHVDSSACGKNHKYSNNKNSNTNIFKPPTQNELADYFLITKKWDENTCRHEAFKFLSYYKNRGWLVTKNNTPMKSWKKAASIWKQPTQKKNVSHETQYKNEGLNFDD